MAAARAVGREVARVHDSSWRCPDRSRGANRLWRWPRALQRSCVGPTSAPDALRGHIGHSWSRQSDSGEDHKAADAAIMANTRIILSPC